MKKILIILVLMLIGVGIYYLFINKQAVKSPIETNRGMPTFTWQYSPFLDGEFPKTHITLAAIYEDNTVVTKEIDTVDGSCNNYVNPDIDVYERSTMIICYAAGLGHYYKIVREGDSYFVMRKTFEEGSPEYTPPQESFETIAQF